VNGADRFRSNMMKKLTYAGWEVDLSTEEKDDK